jgi:two-component system response regulator DctR
MIPTQTIYLCDDDPGVLGALSFLLKKHGFKVCACASGPELLLATDAADKPLRGVFVLDMRMEPMSGPAVHDHLRARGLERRNPVIFLSGHGDIAAAVAAMAKGAFNFVEKPYTDDTLVPLLQQALELEVQWQILGQRRDFLQTIWDSLTPQQRRVALYKSSGELNKVIASNMGLVDRTVEEHWVKVRDKLGVDSVAALATTIADMRACGIDVGTDGGAVVRAGSSS